MSSASGYVEFEFDLPGALLGQLNLVLDALPAAELNASNLLAVPEAQGVYQLFLDGRLVYIGKTDADSGLKRRLFRHARKITHRQNLNPMRFSFKAVRIFVFTAMDLESELIRCYGGVANISWNGSGFGSNDPGRERDTTKVDLTNFDGQFPVDIDRPIDFAIVDGELASAVLARLKDALPYTFRYQSKGPRSRAPHSDLSSVAVGSLSGLVTARQIVQHVLAALPAGWQAINLPGYIILYKEALRIYPAGNVIAHS